MESINSEWYSVKDCMPPRNLLVLAACQYLPSDKYLPIKRGWDTYLEIWKMAKEKGRIEECFCQARSGVGSEEIFNFHSGWAFRDLPKNLSTQRGLIKVMAWSNIRYELLKKQLNL